MGITMGQPGSRGWWASLALVAALAGHWIHLSAADLAEHMRAREERKAKATIEEVCSNNLVPIESVEEFLELARQIRAGASCPGAYINAFGELEFVFAPEVSTPEKPLTPDEVSLCGERQFNKIKNYHFKFVNPLVPSYKFGDNPREPPKIIVNRGLQEHETTYEVQYDGKYKNELRIPMALLVFFKAWALQVAGICKLNFAQNIKEAYEHHLGAEEHRIAELVYELDEQAREEEQRRQRQAAAAADGDGDGGLYASPDDSSRKSDKSNGRSGRKSAPSLLGALSRLSSRSSSSSSSNAGAESDQMRPGAAKKRAKLDFYNLVYLPELEGERKPGDARERRQGKLQNLRDYPDKNLFMHACKYVFKPIYDKLVMPVVKLAVLGYDYQGAALDSERDALDFGKEQRLWMAITRYCERDGTINLAEEPQRFGLQPVDYVVRQSGQVSSPLWIRNIQQLRHEIQLIVGSRATGFARLRYKTGVATRRALAAIDPHRIPGYQRNADTISNVLNSMSLSSNLVSIGLTINGMMGG